MYACLCTHRHTHICTHKYTYLFTGAFYFKRSKNCSCRFQYLLNVTFCLYMVYQFCTAVLIFCSRKLPPTWWPDTIEIYFLVVLVARSLKSGVSRIGSFWRLWGRTISCFSPGTYQQCWAYRHLILSSASVFVWPSPLFSPLLSLIRTHSIGFGTHPKFRMISSGDP